MLAMGGGHSRASRNGAEMASIFMEEKYFDYVRMLEHCGPLIEDWEVIRTESAPFQGGRPVLPAGVFSKTSIGTKPERSAPPYSRGQAGTPGGGFSAISAKQVNFTPTQYTHQNPPDTAFLQSEK